MKGQPVWLASVSRMRPNGTTLYVPEWSKSQMNEARKLIYGMVDGVGNTARERLFRMNVTLCLHRAATDSEVRAQGSWFLEAPGCGLAGGPVEVLKETEPGDPSTRPCQNPNRYPIERGHPFGWIPVDCGVCDPCLARKHFPAAPATSTTQPKDTNAKEEEKV